MVHADENFSVVGDSLLVSKNGQSHVCPLDKPPRYAVESFDKSAVILSEREYVPVELLVNCNTTPPIHVSSIPDRVGFLSDINLSKGLYVSLDFVNVQPFLYLATVSHLHSSKNLVTLNGSYVRKRKLPQLRKHAFGGTDEAGSSIISPDGRFVAPTGEMNCRDDAYPGVWDIAKNKRVTTDDNSCSALFGMKENK